MFTTEMSVIIPLVVLLIIGALIMFFMATELSIFELQSSRDFMLRIVSYGKINNYEPPQNIYLQITDWKMWQVVQYSNQSVQSNPYVSITGKDSIELKTKYSKLWVNKQIAAFIKSGYERFGK